MKKSVLFCALAASCSIFAQQPQPVVGRAKTPISFAIVDPIQLPTHDWDVVGLRINCIYGRNVNFTGLDLGFINATDEVAVGLQIAAGGNYAREARAWQIGVINYAELLKGFQIGVVNYAGTAEGLQIGVVNVIADKDFSFMPIMNASF